MKTLLEQRMERKVAEKAFYDRLSRWYDLLAGQAEKNCRDMGLKLLEVRPGERVLEIGFGTGQCLQALCQSVGSTGMVFGIDISDGMLHVAQARLHKAGLLDRVELKQADAVHLPFEDGLFDALYMSFTLELFDPQEIAVLLRECRRVLRVTGRICIVAMADPERHNLMVKLYNWAHTKWPIILDCRPIDARSEIAQSGFQVKKSLRMSPFGLPVDIILARRD